VSCLPDTRWAAHRHCTTCRAHLADPPRRNRRPCRTPPGRHCAA
jgi:hypothetical protein